MRGHLRVGLLAAAPFALLACGRGTFAWDPLPAPARVSAAASAGGAVLHWDGLEDADFYRVFATEVVADTSEKPATFSVDVHGSNAEIALSPVRGRWSLEVATVRHGQLGAHSRSVVLSTLGVGTAGGAAPVWDVQTLMNGDGDASLFGYSIAGIGDVNADGYDDVLVGAPGLNSHTGEARIFYGGPAGLSSSSAWVYSGSAQNQWVGFDVAALGDVGGDGFPDFLVCNFGFAAAPVTYFEGALGGALQVPAEIFVAPPGAGGYAYGCGSAGDVNHDGHPDAIVGAYAENSFAGAAYVYLGGPAGLDSSSRLRISSATAQTPGAFFGISVVGVGDVDGDGFDDVLVGAWDTRQTSNDVGHAFLFRGGPAGLSTSASWSAAGDQGFDGFGYTVKRVGDVNGDGYADVAIGSPNRNGGAGRVQLWYGGPDGLATDPAWDVSGAPGTSFGFLVAGAGDLDGDGFDDLVVSAPGGAGSISIYPGGPHGPARTPAATITSVVAGGQLGMGFAPVGDLDGDGLTDLVAGAPTAPGTGTQRGSAFAFYGAPTRGPMPELAPPSVAKAGHAETIAASFESDRGRSFTCTWDFGDGVTLTAACARQTTASHAWALPGRYDVRLTVADAFGSEGAAVTQVTIDPSYFPARAPAESAARATAAWTSSRSSPTADAPTEASTRGSAESSRR